MRRVILAGAVAVLSTAALAGEPVVVELFTSQGCSSCPPADALLGRLAEREDVLALSLHVDYWDYIGWKDSFARPAFTHRQKAYARAAGDHSIYTPQMIVEGQERIVGPKPMKLVETIAAHSDLAHPVTVTAWRDGGTLKVRAEAVAATPEEMSVLLVRYDPEETVDIERGENAGRSLTYHNIVTDMERLASWDGEAPLELDVPVPGPEEIAVLVQAPGYGAMLGAARAR